MTQLDRNSPGKNNKKSILNGGKKSRTFTFKNAILDLALWARPI